MHIDIFHLNIKCLNMFQLLRLLGICMFQPLGSWQHATQPFISNLQWLQCYRH